MWTKGRYCLEYEASRNDTKPCVREHLVKYFVKLLIASPEDGCPALDGRTLEKIHRHASIEPYHFAAFIRCLRKALAAHGVLSTNADMFVEIMEMHKTAVIRTTPSGQSTLTPSADQGTARSE